jgi:hypothetical protein
MVDRAGQIRERHKLLSGMEIPNQNFLACSSSGEETAVGRNSQGVLQVLRIAIEVA